MRRQMNRLLLALSLIALCSCSSGLNDSSMDEDDIDINEYELTILHMASKKTYLVGSTFEEDGLEVVWQNKKNQETVKATYEILDGDDLPLEQDGVTISSHGKKVVHPIKVKEKFKVACIGDSLTKGHSWPNESYPSLLSKKVSKGYEIGNFGVNGISITGYGGAWDDPSMSYIKQDIYKEAVGYAPDIALIMLGSNDANNWNKAKEVFETDFEDLLDSLLLYMPNTNFIMLISPPTAPNNAFAIPNETVRDFINPVQRDLADFYKFPFIDLREIFEKKENYVSSYLRPNDGVHLTLSGATLVADEAWEAISSLRF